MTYNDLPLLYADIDEDFETGIHIMSLVDSPAVLTDFVTFAEEKKPVRLAMDEERHILFGVALIPDFPIYRYEAQTGYEYYITFTREVIEKIAIKFFKECNSTSVNLDHDTMVDSCIIFESFLLNKERGICPIEFKDFPNGTWLISTKVTDDKLWADIKAHKYNGYSVEGFIDILTEKPEVKMSVTDFAKQFLKR